ncbi:hypothetical protein ABFX02_06G069700 [Erythranthe guttata]
MEDQYSAGFCIRASRGGCGGGGGGGGTKCGRWNPTSEQVKVLTELFRSGLRTPSTDQIQKISSQLSFYGKIESKNVFYWFQNHKARERQKRRRVLVSTPAADDDIINIHHHHLQTTTTTNTKLAAVSSTERNYGDEGVINYEVSEGGRVIETLQLFPVKCLIGEAADNNIGNCRSENASFITYGHNNNINGATEMDHPTLDLRLSFF